MNFARFKAIIMTGISTICSRIPGHEPIMVEARNIFRVYVPPPLPMTTHCTAPYTSLPPIMERIREEGKIEGIREGKKSGLREGRKSGRLESSRKAAVNLDQMGMPPETIARAVEEDVTVVKQWLKAAKK